MENLKLKIESPKLIRSENFRCKFVKIEEEGEKGNKFASGKKQGIRRVVWRDGSMDMGGRAHQRFAAIKITLGHSI